MHYENNKPEELNDLDFDIAEASSAVQEDIDENQIYGVQDIPEFIPATEDFGGDDDEDEDGDAMLIRPRKRVVRGRGLRGV